MPARALAQGWSRSAASGSGSPAVERGIAVRQREDHLVGLQVAALEPRHARPGRVLVLLGDRHVHAAAHEQREGLLGLLLDQLGAQAGMVARELLQRGQHDVARGGLEGRDPDPAAHLPGVRGELGLHLLHAREQLVAAFHERASRIGELEPAPDLHEQLGARLALELGELLGDRRGGEGERLGRAGDRAVGGEGAQDGCRRRTSSIV